MTIEELVEMNEDIKKHANIFEWQIVEKLTLKRHQFLELFFQKKNIEQPVLLSIQADIRKSDEEIMTIINQQKKCSIASNLNLQNAFNAANEYQKTHNASANT